jgi:hypothetical protein
MMILLIQKNKVCRCAIKSVGLVQQQSKSVGLAAEAGLSKQRTVEEESFASRRRHAWCRLRRARNTSLMMKSAVIPQVSVEPELRAEIEAVLQPGETLSEFVEASVRSAVEFRRVQMSFHERGQATWEHFQSTGVSMSADEVLTKLQAKLDAKRKQLGG